MRRVINSKIQYSLKKTYTYNSFRVLNKLNLFFLKNNFNYFYFLNNFFFNNFFFNNLKFSKNMIFFYKIDKNLIFFSKQWGKKYFKNLSSKNYIGIHDKKYLTDSFYSSLLKTNYLDTSKNKLLSNNLPYWCNTNYNDYYEHIHLFNKHISDVINNKLKN